MLMSFVESFINAEDPEKHEEIIAIPTEAGKFENPVRYLEMTRTILQGSLIIDEGLLFSITKSKEHIRFEEILPSLRYANVHLSL